SDRLFQESYDFIAAQPFTYLHLFPFSARPGTPAAELHRWQPVNALAAQERMKALRALADRKNRAFRQGFLESELSVMTLKGNHHSVTHALSDNFIKVEVATDCPPNRTMRVRVTHLTETGLYAIPLPR